MVDIIKKNLQIFREIHQDRRLCTGIRNVKNFPWVSLKILPFMFYFPCYLKALIANHVFLLKPITGAFSDGWCSCQATWTHLTWGGDSALE